MLMVGKLPDALQKSLMGRLVMLAGRGDTQDERDRSIAVGKINMQLDEMAVRSVSGRKKSAHLRTISSVKHECGDAVAFFFYSRRRTTAGNLKSHI